MRKSDIPFKTHTLLNRLGMSIDIDILLLDGASTLQAIVSSNKNHHRSTIPKNIEHIAFQLNKTFNSGNLKEFCLMEYRYRQQEEWLNWRFNWVGNTPLEGESHPVPAHQLSEIKGSITALNEPLQSAG